MKLSKREKILLIFVLILGLGAVYYFYFLTPFMNDMRTIQKDITDKKAEVNMLSLQNGQLALLDKQIEDLRTQNKALLDKLPTGFDQSDLLQFIYGLIGANAEKAQYTFEKPVTYGKIDSIKATLNFNTNYMNLKKILQTLKTCKFDNRVMGLDSTTKTSDSGGGQQPEPSKPKETATGEKASGEQKPTAKSDNGYNMQVVLTVEFFNLKGDIPADKKYDFKIDTEGKTNLFS